MKTLNQLVTLGLALGAIASFTSVPAFAAKGNVKKAEKKMMAACKKDFPDAVKGKTFKEVADWVETEERGTNATEFKKSKCYNLHEDWEKVAEQKEEGEAAHN